MPQAARAHGSMHLHSLSRTTTSETSPDVAGVSLHPSQAPTGQGPHNSATSTFCSGKVVQPGQYVQREPFVTPKPTMVLVSDASDLGYGAQLGTLKTQRLWSWEELALHINVRDLKAIHLACGVFLPQLSHQVVQVLMDNTVSMFHVNRQGGAWSSALCQEALWLWEFCIQHAIHVEALHLPSV